MSGSLTGQANGLFDNHCHVFRADLPLVAQRRYTPGYDALPESLFDLLLKHGLDGALLVQPSFLGNDNSYLLEALSRNTTDIKLTLKGVVVLDPAAIPDETSLARMENLGVVGLRLNLFKRSQTFDYKLWKPLLATVEERGWHIELYCEAEALPKILPVLIENHSNVVVDHFGLVVDIKNCRGLKTILSQPPDRLWIKASASYRLDYPGDNQALRSHLKELKRIFKDHIGAEHVLWGSDWPFTQFEDTITYKAMTGLIS